MDRLSVNYRYIIVDNEAGMEHLSRMNLRTIDYLFITSDPSARGILTAKRISDITIPLGLDVKHQYLLVNRAPSPVPNLLQEKIHAAVDETGMTLGGIIPASNALIDQELSGKSCLELGDDPEIIQTITAIFDTIFAGEAP
jgi:CO dehydrogenase maturation factor